MLLTITNTTPDARDLSWLLHKRPDRVQAFDLSFGQAHVFYPEVTEERCTAALLLDVDPVDLVRNKRWRSGRLDQYVNDRPFVASSFLSVTLSKVFGSALNGNCGDRPELPAKPLSLEAELHVVPSRGGEDVIHRLFEPLGYVVERTGLPLDPTYPDWGRSPYYRVRLARTCPLCELLLHLYVLIPVLDNMKHYFVAEDEVEKLLAKGAGWLESHPERTFITKRYLKYKPSLARQALERLVEEDPVVEPAPTPEVPEAELEEKVSLNEQRHGAVLAALKSCGASCVLDLGCGEGKLLRQLMKEKQFARIVGMDVSIRSLEIAADRLHLEDLPPMQRERIDLIHGSLMYRDRRLEGFDAACVVEVIEHLDPPRLAAFERVLFEFARPRTIVLTTPNREYNVTWENMILEPATDDRPTVTRLRHGDHRFEWTREEFRAWAENVGERFGYDVRYLPVGPVDPELGPPTQMGVFTCR